MGSQGQVSQRRVSGWAMGLPPMGPGGVLWLGPYGWALQLFSVHCRAASGQGLEQEVFVLSSFLG